MRFVLASLNCAGLTTILPGSNVVMIVGAEHQAKQNEGASPDPGGATPLAAVAVHGGHVPQTGEVHATVLHGQQQASWLPISVGPLMRRRCAADTPASDL